MRSGIFIFQVILFALTINLNSTAAVPKAVNGVLDLREISNPEKFIVKLNGEWEFYWGKMLHPNDFNSDSINTLTITAIFHHTGLITLRSQLKLKSPDMPLTG